MMLTLTAIWDCVRLRTSAQATSWTLHRLSPVRTVNNCHRASLKIMLCMCLGPQAFQKKIKLELGHKLQAIPGGPAQYTQATGVSRKLFVDNLNFFVFYSGILW